MSYLHLADSKAILAFFLANSPAPMLEIFSEVALSVILLYYPSYERIHSEVHVRITDLPTSCTLRDLRRSHLNSLVRVSGVVTRRSGVFPQLKYVKFDCKKCGGILGPFYQDTNKEVKISFCPNCESKGPFEVNSDHVCHLFSSACDAWHLTRAFPLLVDCVPQLPKDDSPGVSWFSPCWSSPKASRSYSSLGSD